MTPQNTFGFAEIINNHGLKSNCKIYFPLFSEITQTILKRLLRYGFYGIAITLKNRILDCFWSSCLNTFKHTENIKISHIFVKHFFSLWSYECFPSPNKTYLVLVTQRIC